MNKDQVSGKIDQAVGKVEQKVGQGVGSEKLANKGVVKQATGAVKETWGDAKNAAKQILSLIHICIFGIAPGFLHRACGLLDNSFVR